MIMLKNLLFFKIKAILICILFLVGCTATPAAPPLTEAPANSQIATSTAVPEIVVGIVEVDLLNLREGPGTSYPIVSSLNKGEKFHILGDVTNSTNNKWLLVGLSDSIFGWVIGDQTYVTIQKELVDVDTYLAWQRNVDNAKSTLLSATPGP
jgi:uncharacterized protein YgiM (DUF1202 family)